MIRRLALVFLLPFSFANSHGTETTESPLTVGEGNLELEASLIDWRRDDGSHAYVLMATELTFGVSESVDLRLWLDAYAWESPKIGKAVEGFGDVQLGVHHNLWGNDRAGSSFSLFPFLKIPTGTRLSNDEWEGGLMLPYATQLSSGVGLGLMAQFDVVYDEVGKDHELDFLHSAVISFDLTENLGSFVEYVGVEGDPSYKAFASAGFVYAVDETLSLDAGIQVGLNDAAEDVGLFFGFTRRW